MLSVGIVSDLDLLSSISESQDTTIFEFVAFGVTCTLLLNVHIPPSFEIDFEFTTEEVFSALCTTFTPVSKFCPFPANEIPVNSHWAFLPFNMLIGYNIEILEPKDPVTHSIFPFCPTIALFVFKFIMFFDQFSIVEYLKYALSFTNNSTQPACKFISLYFGAEHPSIKCNEAPSSTIINVCSNWPAPGAFSLKYDCNGISTLTPFGTYTNEPPDHTA